MIYEKVLGKCYHNISYRGDGTMYCSKCFTDEDLSEYVYTNYFKDMDTARSLLEEVVEKFNKDYGPTRITSLEIEDKVVCTLEIGPESKKYITVDATAMDDTVAMIAVVLMLHRVDYREWVWNMQNMGLVHCLITYPGFYIEIGTTDG